MDEETLRQIGDALSHQQKTLKQLAALLERLQTLREQPEVDPLWSDRDFVQCNVFAAKRAAELGERVYVVRYGQAECHRRSDAAIRHSHKRGGRLLPAVEGCRPWPAQKHPPVTASESDSHRRPDRRPLDRRLAAMIDDFQLPCNPALPLGGAEGITTRERDHR